MILTLSRSTYKLLCREAVAHTSRRSLQVSSLRQGESYKFLVCGGGAGGLAVASSLARRFGPSQVAVIEPSDVSTYSRCNSKLIACLVD